MLNFHEKMVYFDHVDTRNFYPESRFGLNRTRITQCNTKKYNQNEVDVVMTQKLHFLHHHLGEFLRQLTTESDEQGERFQTTMPM